MFIPDFARARVARLPVRALLMLALVFLPAASADLLWSPAQAQEVADVHAALEGYGQWVQHPRWGEVWIPTQVSPDWQPYRLGHWVYTDEWGWYWDSEEDFGWITYHYGRWVLDRGLGWIWIPSREWGPAWVDWRQGDNFVGWAPLPPDEYLDEDYETPDTFLFVRAGELLAPQIYLVVLPPRERFTYYNRSFLVNRSVFLRGGRIAVNPGVPPAFIARARGRPFHPVSVSPVVLAGTAGVAGAVVLRENFRDRERTRLMIHETSRSIQPNDHFVALKPLQKGERGQLGSTAPLAARGVGIETKAKTFGGSPSGGSKNLGASGNQIRNLEIQQKTDLQEKHERKTFEPQTGQKTFQPQSGVQQNPQPKVLHQEFQQKNLNSQQGGSQTNQFRSQGSQNFQTKSLQSGQSNPPRIQQNVQPRVVTPPSQPKSPPPPTDKNKQQ